MTKRALPVRHHSQRLVDPELSPTSGPTNAAPKSPGASARSCRSPSVSSSMNRALLKKLRPGSRWARQARRAARRAHRRLQAPSPRHAHRRDSFGRLAKSYGEAVDLTLYRCIQEGITNAIRHGKAATVSVDLETMQATRRNGGRSGARQAASSTLSDDGWASPQSTPKGFGLTAMTERIRSLGGSCMIESAPKKGTTIRIEIPVERAAKERARRSEWLERCHDPRACHR